MPTLLFEYDKQRQEKIDKFIEEHQKYNGVIHYLTPEDKDELAALKFRLSDVWVYTDDEHWEKQNGK